MGRKFMTENTYKGQGIRDEFDDKYGSPWNQYGEFARQSDKLYDQQRSEMNAGTQAVGSIHGYLNDIQSGNSIGDKVLDQGMFGTQNAMARQAAAGGANPGSQRAALLGGGQAGMQAAGQAATMSAQQQAQAMGMMNQAHGMQLQQQQGVQQMANDRMMNQYKFAADERVAKLGGSPGGGIGSTLSGIGAAAGGLAMLSPGDKKNIKGRDPWEQMVGERPGSLPIKEELYPSDFDPYAEVAAAEMERRVDAAMRGPRTEFPDAPSRDPWGNRVERSAPKVRMDPKAKAALRMAQARAHDAQREIEGKDTHNTGYMGMQNSEIVDPWADEKPRPIGDFQPQESSQDRIDEVQDPWGKESRKNFGDGISQTLGGIGQIIESPGDRKNIVDYEDIAGGLVSIPRMPDRAPRSRDWDVGEVVGGRRRIRAGELHRAAPSGQDVLDEYNSRAAARHGMRPLSEEDERMYRRSRADEFEQRGTGTRPPRGGADPAWPGDEEVAWAQRGMRPLTPAEEQEWARREQSNDGSLDYTPSADTYVQNQYSGAAPSHPSWDTEGMNSDQLFQRGKNRSRYLGSMRSHGDLGAIYDGDSSQQFEGEYPVYPPLTPEQEAQYSIQMEEAAEEKMKRLDTEAYRKAARARTAPAPTPSTLGPPKTLEDLYAEIDREDEAMRQAVENPSPEAEGGAGLPDAYEQLRDTAPLMQYSYKPETGMPGGMRAGTDAMNLGTTGAGEQVIERGQDGRPIGMKPDVGVGAALGGMSRNAREIQSIWQKLLELDPTAGHASAGNYR